jgi:hypothetical protein
MTTIINKDIQQILSAPTTIKLIATINEQGIPHIEEKSSVFVDNEDRILLIEEEEHSRTNLNLVRTLWFDQRAVLYILGDDRRFEIVLRPYKVHISGPIFESYYRRELAKSPDNELSGVWILIPESVTEESFAGRIQRENSGRIPLTHLDRIAK